jgi:leucyl/phenylalanyl-tRNA--protein transferase
LDELKAGRLIRLRETRLESNLHSMFRRRVEVSPEIMLQRYRAGLFPMAETRDARDLFWLDPERRGVLPLDGFHLPRRLRRTALSDEYEVTVDTRFEAVIDGCAAPSPGREESWINREIRALFVALHQQGHAHSVECIRDGTLCGGLYGLVIGGAFFGESMFSRRRDASKVALVHLVARLRRGGFTLLDTQFITEHLAQFGASEIPRARYLDMLGAATALAARWNCDGEVRDEIKRMALGQALKPG